MKMDDVVKAQALLRPVDTISIIRCLAGGEVQVKQYHQNAVVSKGDLLFQLDTTSDTLELEYAQNYHQQLSQDIRNSKLLIVLFDTFLKGSEKRKKGQKVSDRQKSLYSWRVLG